MKQNIFLILCGVIFAFVLAEGGLRLHSLITKDEEQLAQAPFRYVWSQLFLLRRESGAASGIPHMHASMRALHGDRVDFSAGLSTNNLGFIDHRDYFTDEDRAVRIAVAGDSYAAGVGAAPWFPPMAEQYERRFPAQLFNFGMIGTGIENMELLLREFQPLLGITDVVLLVIEGDFGRSLWYPLAEGHEFWFCKDTLSPTECMSQPAQVTLEQATSYIPAGLSRMVESEDPRLESAAVGGVRSLLRPVIAASELLTALNDRRQAYLAWERAQQKVYLPRHFKENRRALERIVALYGKQHVTVALFPTRLEALRGHYDFNTRSIIEPLVGRYVDLWEQCSFEPGDYHIYDHHFTAAGYEKLASCLSETVLLPLAESEISQ